MDKTNNKNIISINPVTRIEGHARITLMLNDDGQVHDAQFHVNEFRGFEKFCEGRYYTEMPNITPRICGICPISHALSSAKACEDIMRVRIPYTADLLRRLMHLGQLISSHALSFFHLSSPDMLFGWDSDPLKRNIVGIAEKDPDLARRGIRLRKFGQELNERLTGKKIHTVGITPGGVVAPLKEDERQALLNWIPEATETTLKALDIFKKYRDANKSEVETYATFDSLHMGLVGPNGEHEVYDGRLRFIDASGKILADQIDPRRYLEFIAETPVEWSYLKYPFFRPLGAPAGYYRVGPLSRLNVADKMKTDLANKEFKEFKQLGKGRPVPGSFYYHYARLIEVLECIALCESILKDPEVLSKDILARAGRNQAEGVGCTEAPRGILFHHYKTDENGILTRVNLLIATGQNNPGMNRSVLEVAKQYVDGKKLKEGALNRVEGAIRCYDPCLSCSTHAMGAMPLVVELVDSKGTILDIAKR